MALNVLTPNAPNVLTPRQDLSPEIPYDDLAGTGQMERGLRSSLLSTSANSHATDFYKALAAGDEEGAKRSGLRAQQLAEEAARSAPRVQSVGDIHGLGDVADYVAGQVGAAPVGLVAPAVGGLAGGLAGARFGPGGVAVGGALGATGAMVPGLRDAAVMQRHQAMARGAPVQAPQEVLDSSLAQGAAQAAPFLLAPAAAAPGRLVGKAVLPATTLGKTLVRGAATQGALGAGSEAIGQKFEDSFDPNRDTSHDTLRLTDAAAGNALVGLPFEAAGHVGDVTHGAANAGLSLAGKAVDAATPSVVKGAQVAGDAIKGAWDKRPKSAEEAALMLGEGAAKLANGAENSLTRVVQRGKDADIDTLLKPQDGLDIPGLQADDAAKHAAASSLLAKIQAAPDSYPSYVQAAAQAYAQGSKMMDSWTVLHGAVQDWKRSETIADGFQNFVASATDKSAKLAADVKKFAEDTKTAYDFRRQNAQTPEMAETVKHDQDGFDPILQRALAPLTGLTSPDAVEHNVPVLAYGMRKWMENGFALKKDGKPVVPDGLLKMFTDPVAAVKATHELMSRQGLVPEGAPPLDAVLKVLGTKIEATKHIGSIVEDNLLPTAQEKGQFSGADHEDIGRSIQQMTLSGKYDVPRLKELFGDDKAKIKHVVDALNESMEQERKATGEETAHEGETKTAVKLSDEGVAETTHAVEPNVVGETVTWHPYRAENSKGPAEPYRVGGQIADNATGEVVGTHEAHAAQRTTDLTAKNSSSVKRVGYMDYLRERYADNPDELMKQAVSFMERKRKELPGKARPEDEINKKYFMLREEQANDRGESTNIHGDEFKSLTPGASTNKWSESVGKNFEYGDVGHGKIWFERADGTKFATSASRIIKRMVSAGKREGTSEGGAGLAGQHRLLMQGITSMLTAKDAEGNHALNGRIGFMKEPGGRVSWDQKSVPDSLRLYSSEGKTLGDAKSLMKQEREAQVMHDGKEQLDKWRERADNGNAVAGQRADDLAAALKDKDVQRAEAILRNRDERVQALADHGPSEGGIDTTEMGKKSISRSLTEDQGEKVRTHDEVTGEELHPRNNEQSMLGTKAEPASDAERKTFFADITRRLGPTMKAELHDALFGKSAKGKSIPLSGDWVPGTIRASVFAQNLGQVGAHESMHEFFHRLMEGGAGAHKVAELLTKAANTAPVVRQLERLLVDHPNALKQIAEGAKNATEERLAYMFQFHQAGLLKLGPETTSTFQKIANFFRKVVGLLSDDQKADKLLRMFNEGKTPTADAAAEVLAKNVEARENMYKAVNGALKPVLTKVSRLVNTAESNLRIAGEGYDDVRRMFKRSVGESGRQGFLDAKDHMMKQWSNKLAAVFEGKEIKDLELAAPYLHAGERPKDRVAREIYDKLKGNDGILPAMHKYLTEAGVQRWDDEANDGKGAWVPMGHVENYFPRVFDTAKILNDTNAFAEALLKHNGKELQKLSVTGRTTKEEVAKAITNRLINSFGAALSENSSSVGFSPFMQAVNKRELHWIAPEILKEYGEKDLSKVMTSYIAQGIKRAEYVRRFGNGGEILKAKLDEAYQQTLTKLQAEAKTPEEKAAAEIKALKIAKNAATDVMAMEGTLGYGINPKLRKFQNSMLVYENMRVLSTSLFSQFIDPLGIVVRGGTMTDAWNSYKRGIREVVASIKGEHIKDLDAKIADQVGTTDANGFLAAFGQLYSSQYMGAGFRKANDMLFKYNGMEGFNRGMQVSATRAAINFIKRHVEQPNDRSTDYLKELNLTAKDVKIDPKTGELDYNDPKIQQAIHQWVNGSIMRPNAAQRPAWGSDPHYMMFWHMKQFAYTFHDTIMKRAIHDMKKYGDMGPAGVLLAAYTPVMIASDAMKSVLLTGEEPGWMRAGLGSEIQHGAMRAGLTGMFQPAADTLQPGRSVAGLGGPVVEQLVQLLHQTPGEAAVNALPGANVLNMLGGRNAIEVQGED